MVAPRARKKLPPNPYGHLHRSDREYLLQNPRLPTNETEPHILGTLGIVSGKLLVTDPGYE
jgi:hypothetical protein